MKIILNYMQKSDDNKNVAPNNTFQLEVFLFKYIHFERKLITDEDFDKARGNILNKCKFPTEAFVKSKRVVAKCLRTFLAEKKDLSFLAPLKKDYPEHYEATEHYLKQFYCDMLVQLIRYIKEMKWKYLMMAAMLDFARKDKGE